MTSFSGVPFVLFCFVRLHAFVEAAAALCSIVLPYVGAQIATLLGGGGDVAFSEYFLYHFRFLFVWRVRFFRMVVFYLVTTGWIFFTSASYVMFGIFGRYNDSRELGICKICRRHA